MGQKYTLQETLEWLKDMGISEILQDTPVNHLAPLPLVTQNPVKPSEAAKPTFVSVSTKTAIPSDISKINSLEELESAIRAFEGSTLKKTAMNMVFADGDPAKADVMLIGEAPGADEDRQGKPFVGLSGQLLNKVFAAIGIDRPNLYITNILPWRPPGNRQPTTAEMAMFLPFVKKHIELVRPKILILVGSTSLKALFDKTDGITRVRGKWMEYRSENLTDPIPTMAIYHPAYLLRSPSRKQDVWHDVLTIKEKLQDLG